MAHGTLIGGAAYGITGGKCLVGGTEYAVTKGRALVSGTGYDVLFGKPTSISVTVDTNHRDPRATVSINGEEVFNGEDYVSPEETFDFGAGFAVELTVYAKSVVTVDGADVGNTFTTDVTGKIVTILLHNRSGFFARGYADVTISDWS